MYQRNRSKLVLQLRQETLFDLPFLSAEGEDGLPADDLRNPRAGSPAGSGVVAGNQRHAVDDDTDLRTV